MPLATINLLAVIMTLGGSPIAVEVPPIFENKTRAMIIFFGSKRETSHNLFYLKKKINDYL